MSPKLRLAAGAAVLASLIAGALVALASGGSPRPAHTPENRAAVHVEEDLLPPHREPPPPPPAPSPSPSPPKPKPVPKPKPAIAVNVDVYKGLGVWVDIYDGSLDPPTVVNDIAARGVKTLYLETNNYRSAGSGHPECKYGPDVDILYPDVVARYLDSAHAKGISVVAWYLPGFADIDKDIRRSLGAIRFATAKGNRFDGFAPDIESRGDLYCAGVPEAEIRDRFNAGIVEYNKRLRAAVPAGTVLGGIVVDAKNNERAPSRWAGFPWPDIARTYDVILPMAYWTASPSNQGCPGNEVDTAGYMREVVSKTQALMGTTKPMHLIGGVADCISPAETAGYAIGSKAAGSLGVSLYDYSTQTSHAQAEALWAELGKFN